MCYYGNRIDTLFFVNVPLRPKYGNEHLSSKVKVKHGPKSKSQQQSCEQHSVSIHQCIANKSRQNFEPFKLKPKLSY